MTVESVGISNRLLTSCHTRLRRPPRSPFSYQGVSTRGVRHSPVFNKESKTRCALLTCAVLSWCPSGTWARARRTRVSHRPKVWLKLLLAIGERVCYLYFARSPENFCGDFFFEFAWGFCIEKWRGFLVNLFWSPSPTKRSTKTPLNNSEQNSGQNSGQKFKKFGELSFCNFSDLSYLGLTKGWFPQGWFGGCSPGTKTGTRVHSDVPPERKPERGTFACPPGTKTGTRAHSPKHPFTKPPFP